MTDPLQWTEARSMLARCRRVRQDAPPASMLREIVQQAATDSFDSVSP